MKLIIDIEKDYYEMLKYNVEHGQKYKPFEIIANGTPYNPSGDCISREALKNTVKCTLVSWGAQGILVDEVLKAIDNAPTVDIKDQIAGAYNEGYMCGNKEAEKARPQGEWIIIDDCEKFIAKCSICGRIEDSRMVKDYPFCHCGAKMKGGAE